MKSIFLLFFLSTFSLIGQERIPYKSLSSDYTLIKSENGLNFYAKISKELIYADKAPFEFGIIKIENTTGKSVQVAYNFAVQYDEGCVNCNQATENYKWINLAAGQVIEGKSSNGTTPTSTLILNPNNPVSWKPIAIAIENLKINI